MERVDPLDLSDIQGATARVKQPRSHPHPFNTNADIEGSAPHHAAVLGRFRSTRCTNTLTPQYNLPSVILPPPAEPKGQPRDILWTLNQPKWRPSIPAKSALSDEEKYHRSFLHRHRAAGQDVMRHKDITGPQFRIEEGWTRRTDPLQPAYVYDHGPVEPVVTHVPRFGSRYVRKPHEDRALYTDDIKKAEVYFAGMYPKSLIKTRPVNVTADIEGTQANSNPPWPRVWTMAGKTPDALPEKETNRVWDIYGAVASTGQHRPMDPPPVYRTRVQASTEARMSKSAPSSRFIAERKADIQAVTALPW